MLTGGDLNSATDEGYLHKSIMNQPFSSRINIRDNASAKIHSGIVTGDRTKITAIPKGGGAENIRRLIMLAPSAGRQGVVSLNCHSYRHREAVI
jgi:fumarate hydratase subunit alpha